VDKGDKPVLCEDRALNDPILAQIAEALRPVIREELGRLLAHQDNGTDRLLTVAEAKKILGYSADYIYRNAHRLPFIIRQGRSVRISQNKLSADLDK
jgi:hypothetical protein